ncbi:hypothetical protein M5689_016103 [Euphorbia peplus]|nr:hypothetical protein M5689_016103 [Euphorbia peplus]
MQKANVPIATTLLPARRRIEGSVFTPIRKMNSIKPNTDIVSRTTPPFTGNTFSAKPTLRPRTEGPRTTPP